MFTHRGCQVPAVMGDEDKGVSRLRHFFHRYPVASDVTRAQLEVQGRSRPKTTKRLLGLKMFENYFYSVMQNYFKTT